MGSVFLTDKCIHNLRPKTKQYEVLIAKCGGLDSGFPRRNESPSSFFTGWAVSIAASPWVLTASFPGRGPP